jgi:RNA polymerase sigma factor (sigma-70 family)
VDQSDGTDPDLLRRLADGDGTALSIVFDRHARAVTRYAWAIASSRQDVEEIVQDTFVTVWRRAAEITIADASLLPWLLVTCRYLALNVVRKGARHPADALPDEGSTDLLAFAGVHRDADAAREQLRWVLDEIERLEPIDRQVCQLCLVEGLSYAEAASVVGISVGAVKQRVSRSRARLRKAVTADEN